MRVRTFLCIVLGTVLCCGGVIVWALLVIDRMVSEAIHDANYELADGPTRMRIKPTSEKEE